MDTYAKLMEKKKKLDIKAEDMELNVRLMYWKYKKQVQQLKAVMKERAEIVNKVKSVQEMTKKQIESDMAVLDKSMENLENDV